MPHCKDCGVEMTERYRFSCDKCRDRSSNNDQTHELALAEDTLRRGTHTLDEVYHNYAYSYNLRNKAEREIVDGSDYRIENLWRKLWDALAGDVERDETWGLFMDAVPGLPDYRVKTYSGTVTLKFYFSDIEVEGGLGGYEIEEAILGQISGDLRYNDADEVEVEYDED
jgi:hypothetical protein